MKQLFSILLSTLILILATKDIGTYVAFKLNQSFIADNWCININKPKVNCCGKCFLKKEIKENQESEKEKSKLPLLKETTKVLYYAGIDLLKTKDRLKKSNPNFDYKSLVNQLFTYNFLDPPEALLF